MCFHPLSPLTRAVLTPCPVSMLCLCQLAVEKWASKSGLMQGCLEAAPVEQPSSSDRDDGDETASSASEEEYEDSSDSGSSSEDEADQPNADPASDNLSEADSKLAQEKAIEEARMLLRDDKDAKNVSYLEDEVSQRFPHMLLGVPSFVAGQVPCKYSSWSCKQIPFRLTLFEPFEIERWHGGWT